MDAQSRPSTDPEDFYGPPKGAILPFGGDLGYRGFALALLVECLGGSLVDEDTTVGVPGTGVSFLVIDVEAFLPREQFYRLVDRVRSYVKSSPPAEGFAEVLLPGELAFRLAQTRRTTGVPIDEKIWEQIRDSALSVGIQWPAEASTDA